MNTDDPKCSVPPRARPGLRKWAMVCITLLTTLVWVLVALGYATVEAGVGASAGATTLLATLAGKSRGVSVIPAIVTGLAWTVVMLVG